MNLSAKNLSYIIAGIAVLGGLYWYFFSGTPQPSLTATAPASADQAAFQSLVGQLAPISFDTSIFSDPKFAALTDLATPVTPEPAGRIDPFAAAH